MYAPQGLSFDGDDLYIADTANHRVLHHQGPIAMSGRQATRVFGQPNFSSNLANNAGPISESMIGSPLGISGSADRLAITDIVNYRVLLWNTMPRGAADLPSLALGQPDFASASPWHGGTVSANGFSDLGGVWTDGTRLALATGNRALIWKTWPTSSLLPTVCPERPAPPPSR